jgi:pheromone shutdown protein TraB
MLGVGIFLIVIGAIVAFVLEVDIPGLGDQALGWVLIVAGLAAIALSFARGHQATARRTTVSRTEDGPGSFTEERRTS